MIPQSFIQDLLNRVDVVEIVGRYVQLKKSGANFSGLCPFHNEKSPSFTVSPTKQFYHCFGCGAHGTTISFLMEYSGLGFVEAVEDLAQQVGMVVPEREDGITPQQRQQQHARTMALSDVMSTAATFYRKQLPQSSTAIDYLKLRGLSGEIARHFELGFSPDKWDALRTVFTDYQASELVDAGLIIDRTEDDGTHKRYDRFRHRIIFPIKNTKGQVIGLGGRVLDSGEPKYLNSPDTPLFQKGNELYGLFEARQAIRDAGYVLVTEGYMDVVALAQLGFPQTVATLGTACTGVHLQKLVRQTDKIIFSFDGDAAGHRAARRALEACLPYTGEDKIIRFLFLPAQHDPDSFIRTNGPEAFAHEINNAMPLSEFLIRESTTDCDLHTAEGRARAQHVAKPMLQAMPASGLRLQLVRSLANETGTTAAELEALFMLSHPVHRSQVAPPRTKRQAPLGVERHVIRIFISHPELINEFGDRARDLFSIVSPTQREMIDELVNAAGQIGAQINFAGLVQHLALANSNFPELIAEIAKSEPEDTDSARRELTGALAQLEMQGIKRQIDQLVADGLGNEAQQLQYRALILRQNQLKTDLSRQPDGR